MTISTIDIDLLLAELGSNRNKFSIFTGLRLNLLQELSDGRTKVLKLESIRKLLDGLNELAILKGSNRRFNVNDLIKYMPPIDEVIPHASASLVLDSNISDKEHLLYVHRILSSGLHIQVKASGESLTFFRQPGYYDGDSTAGWGAASLLYEILGKGKNQKSLLLDPVKVYETASDWGEATIKIWREGVLVVSVFCK